MGTVIINGKTYDTKTGLIVKEIETEVKVRNEIKAEVKTEPKAITESKPTLNSDNSLYDLSDYVETSNQAPKPAPATNGKKYAPAKAKRLSKQERLAQAVAEEFAGDNVTVRSQTIQPRQKKSVPELAIEKPVRKMPNWIKNYADGNQPIEIQPIVISPVKKEPLAKPAREITARHHHRTIAGSLTLNRHSVKKPLAKVAPSNVRRQPAKVATHPNVRHFNPVKTEHALHQTATKEAKEIAAKPTTTKIDELFQPAISHKTEQRLVIKKQASESRHEPQVGVNSSNLKNALINEQLSAASVNHRESSAKHKNFNTRRRFYAPTLITAAVAVMVLGGYFTYVNMPSISVRVAAINAGISGRTPFTPDGYSIDGSVAYSPNSITIKYKANGGGEGYSIVQQSSDISVEETLARLGANDSTDYRKISVGESDLYIYGDDAIWSSDGIIYTLNGNGRLSEKQITRIAESVQS